MRVDTLRLAMALADVLAPARALADEDLTDDDADPADLLDAVDIEVRRALAGHTAR